MEETWLAMEKLVEEVTSQKDMSHMCEISVMQGLVRSIGISNFSIKKTEELLQYCTIIPAVNQVRDTQKHKCEKKSEGIDRIASILASRGRTGLLQRERHSCDCLLSIGLSRQCRFFATSRSAGSVERSHRDGNC